MQANNSITVSTVYTFADSTAVTKVYTFAMAKHVHVQIRGVDHAAKIDADKVEESGAVGSSDFTLVISKGGQPIGKFSGNEVVGWWIQDY